MSEFKQIEPLTIDGIRIQSKPPYLSIAGDINSYDEVFVTPKEGEALHGALAEALGLPDVAELQRRVEKLEAQLEERKEAVDAVAAALQDALTQRNAAVSYLAHHVFSADDYRELAPDLRALVEAARERMEKQS